MAPGTPPAHQPPMVSIIDFAANIAVDAAAAAAAAAAAVVAADTAAAAANYTIRL